MGISDREKTSVIVIRIKLSSIKIVTIVPQNIIK